MVLLEFHLTSLELVFDEIWHDVCHLNVSHFRVQLVGINLEEENSIQFGDFNVCRRARLT